jgi:uncharacterized protein YcbX
MSARVSWISLTPVKSTMLHLVDEAELLESGVRGDRRFYFVTEQGRLFNNKDYGPLQLVRADYDADTEVLALRFADGELIAGQIERGAEVEPTFYKRPRPVRVVVGPWAEAVSELVGQPVRLVEPKLPATDRGRSGAATLLATTSLGRLAQQLGVTTIDQRRFRIGLALEGVEPHEEDGWRARADR